jgi:hypothetical protein
MKLAKKHAANISELFNTITVARMFTDEANTKTAEGRDQWLRWHDNAMAAARELRDEYGITVPYLTERLDAEEDKGPAFIRWMVKCDKEAAEAAHRRSLETEQQAIERSRAVARHLARNGSL